MIEADYANIYEAIAGITETTFPQHARSVRGNVAQLLFRAEAAARGLVPCSPAWNLPVDHILIDYFEQHRLVRVEIKQSQQERKGRFTVELRSSQGIGGSEGSKKGAERLHAYQKSVDVFAILLPKAACWYLIPTAVLQGKSNISISPDKAACMNRPGF